MKNWHVTVLLLLLAQSCEILLANSTSFDKLSNTKVLRVETYLTAFVWKEHFAHVQKQDIFNMFTSIPSTNKTSTTPELKVSIVGTKKSIIKQLLSDILQFKNISGSIVEEFESIKLGSCLFFNIFEEYDIIISEPYEFYTKLKGSRVLGQKRSKSEFLESSDFIPLPLFPLSVIQSDNSNVSTSIDWLNSSSVCSEQGYDTKFQAIGQYEIQWLDIYFDFGKIRESDIEFLSWVNGFKVEALSTIEMESYITKLRMEKHIPVSNVTLSNFLSNLLPSDCTYCTNLYCTQMTFENSDYWIIPVSVLIILYYVILFATKSFQLPAIKRRLLTPYTPIVCVYFETQEMFALDSYCAKVRLPILGTVMNWVILICIFTVIRFYYLRNLYHMTQSNTSVKINNIRKRKALASVWFGIVFTGLISFIVAMIVSLPYLAPIFIVFHSDDFDEFAVTNLLIGVYILIGCFIGIVTVLVDMILNWKKIKERGIRHFLIFDDPFMFRVDLVLFIIIIVLIIIASIPKNQVHVDLFFRFLIYFTFTFVAGGAVIFKSLIEKWMTRGKDFESDFEQYLKNQTFQELLKNYCRKEMSSENFAMYMDLMKIEKERGKNSTLDLETLQNIENDYFLADSMYEVNIPHAAKDKFYQLLNSAKRNEPPTVGELIEALLTEIIRNLYDTFLRLERTKEFQVWLEIYEIQLKNLLL